MFCSFNSISQICYLDHGVGGLSLIGSNAWGGGQSSFSFGAAYTPNGNVVVGINSIEGNSFGVYISILPTKAKKYQKINLSNDLGIQRASRLNVISTGIGLHHRAKFSEKDSFIPSASFGYAFTSTGFAEGDFYYKFDFTTVLGNIFILTPYIGGSSDNFIYGIGFGFIMSTNPKEKTNLENG